MTIRIIMLLTACSLFTSAGYGQNANRNLTEARGLECPRLSGDSLSLYVEHSTTDYGPTFCLEWDCRKKANRWTAYVLNNKNSEKNVSRKGSFKEDPLIPSQYRTRESDYKKTGLQRGHLCPSMDRLCSEEANRQTFYLSNCQPQYKRHNLSLWRSLENMISDKWNSPFFRDTLYVVKAATIDSLHVVSRTWTHLLVPQYFYCALLCRFNDTFKCMGIITPHKDRRTPKKQWPEMCVSIDSLETLTGIDFFCNLPDSIEDHIEAETDFQAWGIVKTE